MNERVNSDEMFKMMSADATSTLETLSNHSYAQMAEKAITRLVKEIKVDEIFRTTDYEDPLDGLLGDLKRIEGPALVNMVITRYKNNEFDLEAAHHDAVTAAFLVRQKFIEHFIEECTLREEVRAERLKQGKLAPDDGFNNQTAQEAVMTHLALTLLEFSTDKINIIPSRYASEVEFKSEIFGMLVDYGMREPARLEHVYATVDRILVAKHRAFATAVKDKTLRDVDGNPPENIKSFVYSKGVEAFGSDKVGARAELFSYALCNRILSDPDSLVRNVPGISGLRIEKSNLSADLQGDVDFVVTGDLDGQRVTLAAIDVVSEPRAEDDPDATLAFALTTPTARIQTGSSGRYKYTVDEHAEKDDSDSDPLLKKVTHRSMGFVRHTGIPVVSVHVPNRYLKSYLDNARSIKTTPHAIATGAVEDQDINKAVSLSADMLDYSLRAAVKNSLEIKYGN